jgi:HSP20 family protein
MMNDFAGVLGGGYDPLRLHGEMSRMIEGFFEDLPASRPYAAGWPALNTWADGDDAWVEAELPGMSMDDLEVLVSDDEVTIAGERKVQDPQGGAWRRRERAQGRFTRTVSLPWEVDADKVEATLRDGVLTVRLPRSEACRPKKVKVLAE